MKIFFILLFVIPSLSEKMSTILITPLTLTPTSTSEGVNEAQQYRIFKPIYQAGVNLHTTYATYTTTSTLVLPTCTVEVRTTTASHICVFSVPGAGAVVVRRTLRHEANKWNQRNQSSQGKQRNEENKGNKKKQEDPGNQWNQTEDIGDSSGNNDMTSDGNGGNYEVRGNSNTSGLDNILRVSQNNRKKNVVFEDRNAPEDTIELSPSVHEISDGPKNPRIFKIMVSDTWTSFFTKFVDSLVIETETVTTVATTVTFISTTTNSLDVLAVADIPPGLAEC